jgi:cysteate synthase
VGSHYRLSCLQCGKLFDDPQEPFLLSCSEGHRPALLRAVYEERRLPIDAQEAGLFRYRRWLPIRRTWPGSGGPVVFQSSGLAAHLKLDALFLAFSGFWPERGAALESCSFKELEALSVGARLPSGEERTLVVSSAGNTGRAFLQAFSRHGLPALVVVPENALPQMWITGVRHPAVRLAVVRGGGDYLDAIEVGNRIGALPGFYPEGGARNVARRDGMGTVALAAAEALGESPRHYFQAVGSGTGAIAAWEMSLRLRQDGRFGDWLPRLHLVQSEPFAILRDAWEAGSRELPAMEEQEAKRRIARIHSPVLSNRNPPYALGGGVFDALQDSGGQTYAVSCEEAGEAGRLFESLEGCDLDAAAEVALAGLVRAVAQGKVRRKESVLLNLTGGGARRLVRDIRRTRVHPDVEIASPGIGPSRLAESLNLLQGVNA